ncbi:hypothetical protein CUMW_173220 [Citrus unshiu]|uniref:Uracil-DNA glycosylase n=1 Tax=Citrus unshiu TaxID=55188 RepID=A0A2H5PW60_CITUN|nr:hypothetical protein CUMW_173220 [Citrus unshiu]
MAEEDSLNRRNVISFQSGAVNSSSEVMMMMMNPCASSTAGMNLNTNMVFPGNSSLIGNSSLASAPGFVQAAANSSSTSLSVSIPGLKHDAGLAVEWTVQEQYKLEQGLLNYADEPNIMKYIRIASTLQDKTVRDVAMRCRWMTRKRRKAEEHYLGKKVNNRKLNLLMSNFYLDYPACMNAADVRDHHVGNLSLVCSILCSAVPCEYFYMFVKQNVSGMLPISFEDEMESFSETLEFPPFQNYLGVGIVLGISGTTRHLLEQNALAFSQIRANLSTFKEQLQDNIELFCRTRSNVSAILNDMRCTPGIMSQMPPLPESINEDLTSSILPNASQSMMLSSPTGIQLKQEPRARSENCSQIWKMGSSKTIMDLFQPAAKRFKLSSPHCCASDNTPNSEPLLQVVSRKLPLSSKSSGSSSATTTSLTAEQQSRIEFNRYVAKSKRNLKVCSQKVSKAKEEGSGYVKLEELLAEETWLEVLHGELQKPYAKRLCEFVEKEIKDSGVDIFPPQHLIFNALNITPFDRVKAVIIGQDPYHGPGQAMGLSFSVPEGVKIPSSLANIFKEIHQDVGCRLPSHGNLEKWAVQGVLLLNTVLTGEGRTQTCKRKSSIRGDDWQRHSVAADRLDDIWRVVGIVSMGLAILEHYERLFHFLGYWVGNVHFWRCYYSTLSFEFPFQNLHNFLLFVCSVRRHQANSHAKKGWEQFTDAVIKAISDKKEGVVFLLWGNSAQEKSRLINVTKHHILKAAHPSGLSANRGFFGCRHFSRTNQILEQMGMTPIDWQL